jgi:CheY-like chemotaxis protein
VDVALRQVNQTVEMTVVDTGQGIAANFLPSVFDAFRQGDGSTTRPHPGLGLGLSIVKSLVEAHGGTVVAESAGEGRGATFTVRLPSTAPSAARTHQPQGSGARADAAISLEGLSVLVVDDDVQSRDIVSAHLESARARVLTAVSAAEAFDILHQHYVDVLLADIAMPDEDGYSLIRRLREAPIPAVASIPAAALTAFSRKEDRQLALDAGFQMHLSKPVDTDALVSAVSRLGKLRRASSRAIS